jgi:hypothetical protein
MKSSTVPAYYFVLLAKAVIHVESPAAAGMDSRFRGNDERSNFARLAKCDSPARQGGRGFKYMMWIE